LEALALGLRNWLRAQGASFSVVFSFCARLLPKPVISDGDSDAAVADLGEDRPLPSLAQAPAGSGGEVINFAPQREGHDAVIVDSAVPSVALEFY
jgi:hypothetical protein